MRFLLLEGELTDEEEKLTNLKHISRQKDGISFDLFMKATLIRCMENREDPMPIAPMLIEHILNMPNSFHYRYIIMAFCDIAFKYDHTPQGIYRFFDTSEKVGVKFCQQVKSRRLPQFSESNTLLQYVKINKGNNSLDPSKDVEASIIKNKGMLGKKSFPVENYFIDLRYRPFNKKLDALRAGKDSFKNKPIDELKLASLVEFIVRQNDYKAHIENGNVLRGIVSSQFTLSRRMFLGQFAVFFLCFLVPFVA